MRFALYNDSHGTDGDGTNGGGSDDDDSDDDDDGGNNDTKDVDASAIADLMDIDRSRTDDIDATPRYGTNFPPCVPQQPFYVRHALICCALSKLCRPKRKRGSQAEADSSAMDVDEASTPKKTKKQQDSAPTDGSAGTPKKKKSLEKKRFELVQGVLRDMFKEEYEKF
jgi:hypothetical protein